MLTADTSTDTLPMGTGTPPATVRALVLTDCVLAGVRRSAGEWCEVAHDRVGDLAAIGYVMPDAWLDRLRPDAAAAWRQAPKRRAVTDASLIADEATIAALWASAGRILTPDDVPATYAPARITRGALRVLNLTQYDPGASVYRYHSAANTVPGVVSAFARFGDGNPHCHLRQWDGDVHRRTVELLAMTADVIHVHMDYRALWHDLRYDVAPHQRLAITYHGSVLPGDTNRRLVHDDADARTRAIRFGARPYHARFGVERYLPIPVPVADYAALAASRAPWAGVASGRRFRVAHSPTRREIKGTADIEAAVQYLAEHEGLPIELVLIEQMAHGAALRLKATCDATFDSFWLGMQGSGLEGAAMGQLVMAGDADAAVEAAQLNAGAVPWTFAADRAALRDVLRRAVTQPAYWAREAERVGRYVARVHDYRAVGARYATMLREALVDVAADGR
jgi:hypothetical protein